MEHSSASPSLADILDVYGAAGCPPRLRAVRSFLLGVRICCTFLLLTPNKAVDAVMDYVLWVDCPGSDVDRGTVEEAVGPVSFAALCVRR
jgi:hypothetical protein